MQIEKVNYHKVFPLGNYSNEKIGVEIIVQPGEDPLDAFAEAKKLVEKSHKFFQDLPVYEKAKKVISDPDRFTGYEVKDAKTAIETFEFNYPDYINKFMQPITREVTEGITNDDYHEYEKEEGEGPFS